MATETATAGSHDDTHEAHHPVPAAVSALAAAAPAHGEGLQPHREAPLEHLGIGEAGVGHVRVHGARAVVARAGPGAAAQGLVILVALVAVKHVVHRALRGCQYAQGAKQRVGDAL